MMDMIVHVLQPPAYVVCAGYQNESSDYRALPLYHGPPPDPALAHPFFAGTVLPYVAVKGWR